MYLIFQTAEYFIYCIGWDLCLSVPPEKVEKAMDQIEKYIMTRQYKYVFCPETTDDEKKDLAVQKRIR